MTDGSAPKRILVVSPTPTHPQTAGNRARIHALVTGIQSLGHDVYFLHLAKEVGDDKAMRERWGNRYVPVPYRRPGSFLPRWRRRICRWMGLDGAYTYGIDEWYDRGADAYIRRLASELAFDAVIVEYVFFSRALRCFDDGVLKLLDTHDVFTDRHRRYLREGRTPLWFSTSRREEARGLDRADVVIAIQKNEARYFREITHRRVITVGHVVPLGGSNEDDAGPPDMLYVGSNNEINVHAARYFIGSVLPAVRERIPAAVLTVAGGVCDKLAHAPGVRLLGQVEDLAPVYRSAAVVVNPILFGTGLKIKTVEALGFGKPLVTTSAGAEGLDDLAGKAFRVADSDADFADAVVALLSDHEARRVLSASARKYAADWNRKCMVELTEALGGKTASDRVEAR